LGLGDAVTVAVDPGQRVIALSGAEVDENAFGGRAGGRVRLGRVDDVGQLLDRLLQAGVGGDGVVPDLIGVGREVDLVVGLAVEQPRFLGVQVVQGGRGIRLEEGLVGPYHLGVFAQPVANPLPQANDPVDPVGG